MRTLLLAVMLLGAAPAWAGWWWWEYAQSDLASFQYDPESIKKDRHLRRVWHSYDLHKRAKTGELSSLRYSEFDCKSERRRILQMTTHRGRYGTGEVLLSTDSPGTWRYVAPGTADESLLKIVCK